MASKIIPGERIRRLNEAERGSGRYLLYWMQQSQRAEFNHALEFAIQRANSLGCPLLVGFGLMGDYPDANLRHFHFMLEGLAQTAAALRRRRVGFVMRLGDPAEVAIRLAKDAVEVVCDRGYLRHQRRWRRDVADQLSIPVWEVETDVVVPVETASDKREYAARTIRGKLQEASGDFLTELRTTPLERDGRQLEVAGENEDDRDGLLRKLDLDRRVEPVDGFSAGTAAARSRLKAFCDDELDRYNSARRDLKRPSVSRLSPYLHFGQISPVVVAREVESASARPEAKEAFLEELIVRRELSMNFVHFTEDYDRLSCLPDWAAETLEDHAGDRRDPCYEPEQLEAAETHDRAWNAAMTQMKRSGYLHNHLRMYWGKKILHWSRSPEEAHRTALTLNNRYFVDGRDANSFANVAWLFGLHDRAHQEREIFGKVRYMSAAGLDRKVDVEAYVAKVLGGRAARDPS